MVRDPLVVLQRAYGNRHVQRVLERAPQATDAAPVVPSKLIIGPADGRYEQEADRIAAQVSGPVAPTGPAPDVQAAEADPWVRRAIHNAGAGRQVPDLVRSSMEQAVGADLRSVRVHTDAQADQLNDALNAEAFTSGRHIFFRRGAYAPQSGHGRALLTHELAHVVQQGGTGVGHSELPHGLIQRKMAFSPQRLKKYVPKRRITKPTLFDTLSRTLDTYEQTDDDDLASQFRALQQLEVLAYEWLGEHGSSTKAGAKKKAVEVQAMLQEVEREMDALSQERRTRYLERVVATSWATLDAQRAAGEVNTSRRAQLINDVDARLRDQRFNNPTPGAQFNYITQTGAGAMSLFSERHRAALQAVQDYSLTEEELAAIRVYTAGDFLYMNPTQANSQAWLLSKIAELSQETQNETTWALEATRRSTQSGELSTTQRRELQAEAREHIRQAMSGLNRLPTFSGTVYRGSGKTQHEIDTQYQVGGNVVFPSLTSSSKNLNTSKLYALKALKEGKIPVLLELTVTKGKDIQQISTNTVEEEVLLLAGARFVVTQAQMDNGVWRVRCKQVEAGSTQIGSGNSSAQAAAPAPISSTSSTSSTSTWTMPTTITSATSTGPTTTATSTASTEEPKRGRLLAGGERGLTRRQGSAQDVGPVPAPRSAASVPASSLSPSSVGGPPPVLPRATKPKLKITKTDRPTRSPTALPEQPRPASSSSSSAMPTSQHGVLRLRSPLQLQGGRLLPQGTVIELGKKTRQTNEIEVKAAGERQFTLVSVDSLRSALGELEDPSDLDL